MLKEGLNGEYVVNNTYGTQMAAEPNGSYGKN